MSCDEIFDPTPPGAYFYLHNTLVLFCYSRRATRSCRTRLPGAFILTGPTRHRVRVRSKIRRVFGPGTRVPVPNRVVPVKQRVPVVNMPDNNLRNGFEHAANDPEQYSHNTYQLLRMQLRRLSMIMSISGRLPGYPGTPLTTRARGQHS